MTEMRVIQDSCDKCCGITWELSLTKVAIMPQFVYIFYWSVLFQLRDNENFIQLLFISMLSPYNSR